MPFEFTMPEFRLIAPVLIVFGVACIGILIEALVPRQQRFVVQSTLACLSLVAALGATIVNWQAQSFQPVVNGVMMLDGPTYFMWTMLLLFTLFSLLLFGERQLGGGASAFAASAAAVPGSKLEADSSAARMEHTEIFPLALFALSGMLVFPAANDLLTMFVAIEVMSLPLYLMASMARRRRLLSQEAALKYFLLGSTSSAFFLFGVALVFGYAGSFAFADVAAAIHSPTAGHGLLVAGVGMLSVGVLFKVGAVPFHSWTPDVYQGSPTPVTGFMAVCTKIAAVGGLLRLFYVALGAARWDWQLLVAIVAVLTIVVGSVVAVVQTDIKRMLAYSSIAHGGFILTAVVGTYTSQTGLHEGYVGSVGAVMFYLAAYGFATLGAFAIVTLVRNAGGEATNLSAWAGLGRRSPVLAGLFGLFLLSFAGIPLTGGFIGKFSVFESAWEGGFWWLVVVAVVMSLVAAFFYMRVIVIMFFSEPAEGTQIGSASWLTWVPILVGAVATLVLGILPGGVLELAAGAAGFLR
ncbi:NADH-quinone oxidoreductase subunit NuoN [Propionicicella superfundia]|uniref:NADH-quinone oxidoreductase subunit NuoN n=1 Tax=Propionicicella superfundia TaxID=348582 RepID=UPI000402E42E|nr:NADH-quinone oxidoreductase subunit NuoN [Propionicicella superfundia]